MKVRSVSSVAGPWGKKRIVEVVYKSKKKRKLSNGNDVALSSSEASGSINQDVYEVQSMDSVSTYIPQKNGEIESLNSEGAYNIESLHSEVAENVESIHPEGASNIESLHSEGAENFESLHPEGASNIGCLHSEGAVESLHLEGVAMDASLHSEDAAKVGCLHSDCIVDATAESSNSVNGNNNKYKGNDSTGNYVDIFVNYVHSRENLAFEMSPADEIETVEKGCQTDDEGGSETTNPNETKEEDKQMSCKSKKIEIQHKASSHPIKPPKKKRVSHKYKSDVDRLLSAWNFPWVYDPTDIKNALIPLKTRGQRRKENNAEITDKSSKSIIKGKMSKTSEIKVAQGNSQKQYNNTSSHGNGTVAIETMLVVEQDKNTKSSDKDVVKGKETRTNVPKPELVKQLELLRALLRQLKSSKKKHQSVVEDYPSAKQDSGIGQSSDSDTCHTAQASNSDPCHTAQGSNSAQCHTAQASNSVQCHTAQASNSAQCHTTHSDKKINCISATNCDKDATNNEGGDHICVEQNTTINEENSSVSGVDNGTTNHEEDRGSIYVENNGTKDNAESRSSVSTEHNDSTSNDENISIISVGSNTSNTTTSQQSQSTKYHSTMNHQNTNSNANYLPQLRAIDENQDIGRKEEISRSARMVAYANIKSVCRQFARRCHYLGEHMLDKTESKCCCLQPRVIMVDCQKQETQKVNIFCKNFFCTSHSNHENLTSIKRHKLTAFKLKEYKKPKVSENQELDEKETTIEPLQIYDFSSDELWNELEKRKHVYRCDCSLAFDTKDSYDIHKQVHGKHNPKSCTVCGATFGEWKHFCQHLFSHS